MRHGVCAAAGVALLLVSGCSDTGGSTEPPKPTATTTVTVPTAPPTAAAAVLGPTGPSTAKPCKGTDIPVGTDPQPIIDAAPEGTTFCFAKGVHRLTRPIQPRANDTLAGNTGAVLSGSVRLTGWKQEGSSWTVQGALPAAYPLKGQCEDNKTKPCQVGEQVFQDGNHLTRVMSPSQLKPGTFFGDYKANTLYLGDDPTGHVIEMAKTQTAIDKSADNVTVTGLTIQQFASRPQAGALQAGAGWKVTANEVRWNHAVGIMVIEGDNTVVSRNTVADNGQLGIGQYKSAGVKITANLVTRNNTDGFWIADWESGGIKSTRSSGEVSGNDIIANRGIGMWSDIAEYDRRITGNRIRDNAADGIRYEISYAAVIDQNVVEHNGFGTGRGSGGTLWDGGGINVNTSADVQVRGNLIKDNRNALSIQSRTRGDGPRGTYVLRNVLVEGNLVVMSDKQSSLGVVENKRSPTQPGAITFRRNSYQGADHFAYRGKTMSWSEWQQSGFDQDSVSS
ncbi:right-handed parallel beta-helix repeat-containing protein [Kribbella jiaozuonensis]|uniref:Right-handed parallel beta-helix repeat-containing protein n=1 Tax=Kribbella jiaozuonensis TaxID=2575441 RepID=A0A4U3LUD3_9ACTN|nr:right-handed parallel beta-helix repeat-containing protein [Kribbella jiaozuonensis]TKK79420.1 right-handed parallel beta-helix repeat-containing protein [Kribbella jiaozuonensis]